MIRTQIQLTREQVNRLKKLARMRRISMAEAVRQLIDHGFEQEEEPDRRDLFEKAEELLGAFKDPKEATDLSVDHDRYLDESFR